MAITNYIIESLDEEAVNIYDEENGEIQIMDIPLKDVQHVFSSMHNVVVNNIPNWSTSFNYEGGVVKLEILNEGDFISALGRFHEAGDELGSYFHEFEAQMPLESFNELHAVVMGK